MPAVSQIPSITLTRFLGIMPKRKKRELIDEKSVLAPVEIGVVRAIAEAVILPVRFIAVVGKEVRKRINGSKNKD